MNRERFKDALWYNNKVEIVIGGAGGIGLITILYGLL
jgi:hypothetical protein